MARIRTVKPEFWRHPVYARLPDNIQLLALSLLTMADDEGYFRAEAELVRGDVQPFREDLASISRGIQELSRVGWIEVARNSEQGQIGRICNFSKHQRVDHPTPSKLKTYFLEKDSRTPRESLALEQGTGNMSKDQKHLGGGSSKDTRTPPPTNGKWKQSDFDERDLRKLSVAEREIGERLKAAIGSQEQITDEQFFEAVCEKAGLTVQRGLALKKIQKSWPKP